MEKLSTTDVQYESLAALSASYSHGHICSVLCSDQLHLLTPLSTWLFLGGKLTLSLLWIRSRTVNVVTGRCTKPPLQDPLLCAPGDAVPPVPLWDVLSDALWGWPRLQVSQCSPAVPYPIRVYARFRCQPAFTLFWDAGPKKYNAN